MRDATGVVPPSRTNRQPDQVARPSRRARGNRSAHAGRRLGATQVAAVAWPWSDGVARAIVGFVAQCGMSAIVCAKRCARAPATAHGAVSDPRDGRNSPRRERQARSAGADRRLEARTARGRIAASAEAPRVGRCAARRSAAHLFEWRAACDRNLPAVVTFAQTEAGKFVLFAIFAGADEACGRPRLASGDLAGDDSVRGGGLRGADAIGGMLHWRPSSYFWRWFRSTMARSTQRYGTSDRLRPSTPDTCAPARFAACLLPAAAALLLARRFRDHPVGRRPVLLQHVPVFRLAWPRGLACVARRSTDRAVERDRDVTRRFFWFLAYALMEQRSRDARADCCTRSRASIRFSDCARFPWGKGTDNWRGIDAASEQELAVIQLSALKLLVWACILKGAAMGVSRDRLRQTRRNATCRWLSSDF